MASDASRTAEGDLASTPLAHVLVHALDRRLSGTLELFEPGASGPHVLALVRGAPARIALEGDRERLGDLLVERGAIGREVLERFLADHASARRPRGGAELPPEGRVGALLALFGLVSFDEVEATARAQVLGRARRLFSLPAATTFRFVLEDGRAEEGELAVHPLAFLWAGLRAHAAASSKMASVLEGIRERPLFLHASAPVELLDLSPRELSVIEVLVARRPRLAELCVLAPGGVSPEVVRALVYALAILRHLDFGPAADGRTRPPVGGPEEGERAELASAAPPSSASSPPGPVPIGRLHLRSARLRPGIAAPDEPGAGDPTSFRQAPRSRPPRPPGSGEGGADGR